MSRLALSAVVGLAVGFVVAAAPSVHAQEATADQVAVRVTFYTLRGTMASGVWTHKDAAACSRWIPFGTQLRFSDGYVVTCEDRGHGDWYWSSWVDVWSPDYAWGIANVERDYGLWTTVTVLRWGWAE